MHLDSAAEEILRLREGPKVGLTARESVLLVEVVEEVVPVAMVGVTGSVKLTGSLERNGAGREWILKADAKDSYLIEHPMR